MKRSGTSVRFIDSMYHAYRGAQRVNLMSWSATFNDELPVLADRCQCHPTMRDLIRDVELM